MSCKLQEGLTSLSPDCSPPYLLVPIASNSSIKMIAPCTEWAVEKEESVKKEGKEMEYENRAKKGGCMCKGEGG